MARNKTAIVISILVILVLILGTLVVYSFVLKPVVSGYVVNSQNQGVQYAILTIMQQASTCQEVPLTFGNQTMRLIWIDCLQQSKDILVQG
ncbi:hypothetical protein HYT25_00205 [Candidatus Pacearchaeota archaeon]|nr:hypothetical protein [Candidatus Pacearchaeota archaeon]